ncbi:MAG: type II secretion system GspH family protein [Candidatus Nomurabacteria bacterium]|jgi:prepilin-type N-terminal cleavage/methylation domain-containing protein|nr:type II secretion system GspH family protein [Candidatus Nomurabacteria bacterium]
MIRNKKGFTIIEVVLVLAIAGLIFLMVFIALPALQSSQRNTQRGNDLDRFLTAATDFASNNSGRLPFTIKGSTRAENSTFVARYIDDTCTDGPSSNPGFACVADQFRDPDGNLYQFSVQDGTALATDAAAPGLPTSFEAGIVDKKHVIVAVVGVMCGVDEGTVTKGTGDRQVALFMVKEGGGISCVANN